MRFVALSIGLLVAVVIAGCEQRPSQTELAAIERTDRLNDQERRTMLAQQVASGEKSSAEAACDYRLGLWDADQKVCFDHDDPLILRPPAREPSAP